LSRVDRALDFIAALVQLLVEPGGTAAVAAAATTVGALVPRLGNGVLDLPSGQVSTAQGAAVNQEFGGSASPTSESSLFAGFVTGQYMDQSGEGIDPPYGALSNLIRKVRETRLSIYDVADALRSWRI
jgi:hypothetical protein